jgi:peptidoglycan/LPS O-acetylase OafA/YrhL
MAGVVAYHASFMRIFRGAGFAVSFFFTLSGFLMGTRLCEQAVDRGRVKAAAFWTRRFRRLLPASTIGLVLVLVYTAYFAPNEQLLRIRADVFSAIGYVSNIRFALAGRSYVDGSLNPTPVLTYWSLSLEEQFYFVLPVIIAVVLWLRSSRSARSPDVASASPSSARTRARIEPRPGTARAVAWVSTVLFVLCSAWLILLAHRGAPFERLYYSPEGRFGECFAGVALAAWRIHFGGFPETWKRFAAVAAVPLLGIELYVWYTVDIASEITFKGALAALSLATCVILIACSESTLLARALAVAPLPQLGHYSYGMYVYHWPLILILSSEPFGLGGWTLGIAAVSLTVSLAAFTYHWIEVPIQRNRLLRAPKFLGISIAATLALTAGTLAATRGSTKGELNFKRVVDPDVGAADVRLTVMVVGDSLATNTAQGLFATKPSGTAVLDRSTPGCGLAVGERRTEARWVDQAGKCDGEWKTTFRANAEKFRPQIALALWGTQETWDRRVNGKVIPFDSEEGAALREAEIDEAVQDLLSGAPVVVLLKSPAIDWVGYGAALIEDESRSVNNPDWIALWNRSLERVARRYPGKVRLLDTNELLSPGNRFAFSVDGVEMRTFDGLHLTPGAQRMLGNWLWGQFRQLQP